MPLTQVDQGLLGPFAQYTGFKNRIINGAMVIDQRRAGASVTQAVQIDYLVDRWAMFGSVTSKMSAQQNAGSVTPPPGFSNYLGFTSLSAYTVGASEIFITRQPVEGLNVADFAWGTANAQPVTLSFWVRSSLTGTFGGVLQNSAQNRSYPFSYTISASNTWEQKAITIPGDTTGTWLTTNGVGVFVTFGLGVGSTLSGPAGAWAGTLYQSATGATSVVGTNAATWYITGVQLEEGRTATSFDVRPYGTELALCQRYYYKSFFSPIAGYSPTTSRADGSHVFPVPMRIAPTALETTGTASDYGVYFQSAGTVSTSIPTFASPTTTNGGYVRFNCSAVFTIGQGCLMAPYATTSFLAWSAEL